MSTFPEDQILVEIRPDGSPVEAGELSELVDDAWIADQLKMKVPTIRSQRHKRRHSQDHWFEVDPTFIGSKPRYRRTEVLAWIESQSSSSPKSSTAPASGSTEV